MDMTHRLDSPRRHIPAREMAGPGYAVRPAALLQALWRRKSVVALSGLLLALAAGAIALAVPRSYTSTAQILIDPRGLKLVEKDIAPQAREPDLSVSIIESEMRILGSDLVLNRVIDHLQLAAPSKDAAPASMLPAPLVALRDTIGSTVAQFKSMLGRSSATMTPDQAALLQLQRSVRVSRQPNTYVVDVAVTDKDRDLAARIANAVAAQYISARFDGRAEASRRAAEAIDGRLDELRDRVRESDGAVERYKKEQGLTSSSGRLLTEQRLGELSTQLQVARGETVRAQTRVDEISAARRNRAGSAANLDALQSATLERLRSSQAVARQREASLSATMLPSHPLVRQARQEVQSVERSVDQELTRIAETATAALERARATERALERQLTEVTQGAARDSAATVELRELERVAEANRSIYQSFLVRTRELVEQQRIDPSIAVMLASAEPGRVPSGPGLFPVVVAAGVAGLGLGAALALRRDSRDPRLYSSLQLDGAIPSENVHRVPVSAPRLGGLRLGAGSRPDRALYFSAPPGSATAVASDRLYRALGTSARRSASQIYVVVAAEPYQGKSTVALNLAAAVVRAGDNVLLIDADRDAKAATLAAGVADKPGLAEVVLGSTPCLTAIVERTDPPIHLLPAGQLEAYRPSRAQLQRLSEALLAPLDGYDVIVVDATAGGRDRLTQAIVSRADGCLLVAQEGSAVRASVEDTAVWLEGSTGGAVHVVLVQPA